MAIEGLHAIRMTFWVKLPPGADPEVLKLQIAQGAVTVAVGLIPYLQASRFDVVPADDHVKASLSLGRT
jgi:hypothetical protein